MPGTQTPKKTRKPQKTTCKAHCRECGRHFASTRDFDAHREGDHKAPILSLDGRHCRPPERVEHKNGKPYYEAEIGECRIAGAKTEFNVAIWFSPQARQRVNRVFKDIG